MEILQFTSSQSFNTIFTIYVHLSVITLPIFAIFGLFRSRS